MESVRAVQIKHTEIFARQLGGSPCLLGNNLDPFLALTMLLELYHEVRATLFTVCRSFTQQCKSILVGWVQ